MRVASLQNQNITAEEAQIPFGYCSTRPALGYMEIVAKRDAKTLLKIIKKVWLNRDRLTHLIIFLEAIKQ